MYQRTIDKSPESLVNQGKYNWGTFNAPIKRINPLDASMPLYFPAPRFYKYFRLKEWQAFQAGNNEWFIFGAVYNAKISAIVILSIYHKISKTAHHYQTFAIPSKLKIGNGLLASSTQYVSKNLSIQFDNDIANNKIYITAFGQGKKMPKVELGLTCSHQTEPIVISQPFGKNRGLYSHKALMPVKGNLKIENQLIHFDIDESFCIIDDHKGYYPYKVTYDWVTAAGMNSEGILCGFNLTHNQVQNPEKYNENCLWYRSKMYLLPPIQIKRTANTWVIQDDYGWVNLKFYPKVKNNIKMNFLLLKTDYEGPYGYFEGFIKIPNKMQVDFTDFFGMGEKKRNRM